MAFLRWSIALPLVLTLSTLSSLAPAQINVGSDGSDGALNSTSSDYTFDLRTARTGKWDEPSSGPLQGVYDPEQWAVVYKLTSFNWTGCGNMRFINHPSGAPVVFLVQGNVTIGCGVVNLDGGDYQSNGIEPTPGPGGFRGGRGVYLGAGAAAGYGPGGGGYPTVGSGLGSGSYSTTATGSATNHGRVYGNVNIIPLIGGSGGQGGLFATESGGAGAGAILIAAGGTITLNGDIYARGGDGVNFGGGSGSGSGGAVRLVGNLIQGGGRIVAHGGSAFSQEGGVGRVRIETRTTANLPNTGFFPQPSYFLLPTNTPQIWPNSSTPAVRIKTVAGLPVNQDPRPNTLFPADVTLPTTATVSVVAETNNVPTVGSQVLLRVVPRFGTTREAMATYTSGDQTTATWTATIPFNEGFSTIQGQAILP